MRRNQQPHDLCGNALPDQPTRAYADQDRERGREPCLTAQAGEAWAEWVEANPDTPADLYPGLPLPGEHPDGWHLCGAWYSRLLEPSDLYARYDRERRTGEACGWAKGCAAYERALARNLDRSRADYTYRPRPPAGETGCRPGSPVEPTRLYARRHAKLGTPTCRWARRCAALQLHLDRGGTIDTWPDRHADTPLPGGHDCDSDLILPTQQMAHAHRRDGTPQCWTARASRAFQRWRQHHPGQPLGEWPALAKWLRRRDNPAG